MTGSTPVRVPTFGPSGVYPKQVELGTSSTCVTLSDGSAWTFGRNTNGQLGIGSTTDKSSPTQVTSLGTSVGGCYAGSTFACFGPGVGGSGGMSCTGAGSAGQHVSRRLFPSLILNM